MIMYWLNFEFYENKVLVEFKMFFVLILRVIGENFLKRINFFVLLVGRFREISCIGNFFFEEFYYKI